ncbi:MULTISPECIES: OmpH family outer membrane protein [Novosphingobium]|uniref:OmpH family outer membrane protein n=1 Tax=Novosphingobium TaxID=165696 RepID=UPI001CD47F94|nr:OmpH family outer membrane protein [Novosphingobium percolationis]
MITSSFRIVTLVAATLSLGGAALAQAPATAPAPAAEAQGLGGPLVPGVCLLAREAVIANSKVGIAAAARLKQIAAEAQAEIDAERKPLEAQMTVLRAQAPTLTPDQRRAQEKALADKFAPIQAKADLRSREIERTRAKAIEAISAQAQPVIAAVYKEKGCGLLFDRASVLGGNYGNDLTAGVVKGLDAKITTLDIRRETLPPAPAPAR